MNNEFAMAMPWGMSKSCEPSGKRKSAKIRGETGNWYDLAKFGTDN